MAAIKARGWSVLMTISGPVPKWATQDKLDNLTRPSPSAFAAFVDRGRAQVRRAGRHVGDLERAQPAAVPAPAVRRRRQGGVAGGSTATSTSPACAGCSKAGQGDDTILIAETSPRGNRARRRAAALPARRCSASTASTRSARKCSALTADGYAHHAYTTRQGPFFMPPQQGRRDDRRALAADEGARPRAQRRRADEAPADLPHGVRHPVHARPAAGRVARAAGPVPRDLRADRLEQPARRGVLAVPADRQRADRAQAVRRLRVGPALRRRQAEAVAGRRSACRSPSSGPARRSSIWGLVRPATGATTATITYADRGASRFKTLRTVTTDARGYFTVSSTWRKGRRWNLTWEGQSGSPVESYQSQVRPASAHRVRRQAGVDEVLRAGELHVRRVAERSSRAHSASAGASSRGRWCSVHAAAA